MTKNVEVNDRIWQALQKRAQELSHHAAKVGIIGTQATEQHRDADKERQAWKALRKKKVRKTAANKEALREALSAAMQQSGATGATNVEIAVAMELGTATIPSRPFIRQAFLTRRGPFEALAARLAKAFLLGKMSAEQVMGLLGAWGQNAIKATITRTGSFAPLAPATIRRKGSSRPLVDTGQLANSVSWIVVP